MGAYGIGPRAIIGGPDWLDSDRFEIMATAPQPTEDDHLFMEMLPSLLAERFKLALHRETRTLPAFVLEVGKNGQKLEKAEAGEAVTSSSHIDTRASIETACRESDGISGVFNFRRGGVPTAWKGL